MSKDNNSSWKIYQKGYFIFILMPYEWLFTIGIFKQKQGVSFLIQLPCLYFQFNSYKDSKTLK